MNIHFITQDNEKMTAKAKVGDNLLDVIIDNDLDIDGFGKLTATQQPKLTLSLWL